MFILTSGFSTNLRTQVSDTGPAGPLVVPFILDLKRNKLINALRIYFIKEFSVLYLDFSLFSPKTKEKKTEPPCDKTSKMVCEPNEDSDQPGYPPSLIRVFAVRSMGS